MEFHMELDCDNAAFEGDAAVDEIARILGEVESKLRSGRYDGTLRDINGNRVGSFELVEDEDDEDDDEMPDECRDIFERAQAGEDLEVLGVAQSANRVYDDGRWRVWVERVGPDDGYFGDPVTVEHYDGNCWSDFPTG